MIAGLQDFLHILALVRVALHAGGGRHQLPESDDGIERGAQLVAHAREELALGGIGPFGLGLGPQGIGGPLLHARFQRLVELLEHPFAVLKRFHGLLAFGHVLTHTEQARDLPAGIAHQLVAPLDQPLLTGSGQQRVGGLAPHAHLQGLEIGGTHFLVQTGRNQGIEPVPAKQILRRMAAQLAQVRVGVPQHAFQIDHEDDDRCDVDQPGHEIVFALQFGVELLDAHERRAHRFGKDGLEQVGVGNHLVHVAQQVGGAGDLCVHREEQFAGGHEQHGMEQRERVVLLRGAVPATPEQGGPQQVQAAQQPLQADFERSQALAGHEHGRQPGLVGEHHVAHRSHRHQRPAQQGPPLVVLRLAPGVGRYVPQQPQPDAETAGQPEPDHLVGRIRADDVGHARVGQGVDGVEQRRGQEEAAQHHHPPGALGLAGAKGDEEHQPRDPDGDHLQQRMAGQEHRLRHRDLPARQGLPHQQRHAQQQQGPGQEVPAH